MNLDWGLGEGNDERKRRGEGSVGEVVAWGRGVRINDEYYYNVVV